jgi:hypothetical protein
LKKRNNEIKLERNDALVFFLLINMAISNIQNSAVSYYSEYTNTEQNAIKKKPSKVKSRRDERMIRVNIISSDFLIKEKIESI